MLTPAKGMTCHKSSEEEPQLATEDWKSTVRAGAELVEQQVGGQIWTGKWGQGHGRAESYKRGL